MNPPAAPDITIVNRIEALLAKAESTEFPEEAEAFLAKAQALMSRHAVDQAVLDGRRRVSTSRVTTETIVIVAPYASAKSMLLATVASANDCRVVTRRAGNGDQQCIVLGFDTDLANVRLLYSSLSVHAVRAMLGAPVPPFDTPRRFRHAFLLAFGVRIGERLQAARRAARAEAASESADGGRALGLVLADRESAVAAAFAAEFPHVRTSRVSASSSAGVLSGRRAADTAGLHRAAPAGAARGLRAG